MLTISISLTSVDFLHFFKWKITTFRFLWIDKKQPLIVIFSENGKWETMEWTVWKSRLYGVFLHRPAGAGWGGLWGRDQNGHWEKCGDVFAVCFLLEVDDRFNRIHCFFGGRSRRSLGAGTLFWSFVSVYLLGSTTIDITIFFLTCKSTLLTTLTSNYKYITYNARTLLTIHIHWRQIKTFKWYIIHGYRGYIY